MRNYQKIIETLVDFLQKKVKEKGFKSVVFGLSGGIDSAVVAALCKQAFGDNIHGILMPSLQSSTNSIQDALELCESFKIPYSICPLEKPQKAFLQTLEGLQDNPSRIGNLCARIRMIYLYDYAFANQSLVIGTSNKSEILLGYGTIFGDLACAINPIGNLYKTEIFKIAKILQIPQSIQNKAPSADLYEGQSDEKELGFSYAILDEIMLSLEKGLSKKEMLEKNLSKTAIEFVLQRMQLMEFKRKMPEIASLGGL